VHYFVARYAAKVGRAITSVPKDAMQRLMGYRWPGNVRELENVLERVAVLLADGGGEGAGVAERELRNVVPELFGARRQRRAGDHGLRGLRRADERAHVLRVLDECGGNQGEAARRLGIGRTTLWRKLREEA
jgi:propionate catabolism operon transcriptional regulator